MPSKLVGVSESGDCELFSLVPYPAVGAGDATVEVVASVDASGKTTYTIISPVADNDTALIANGASLDFTSPDGAVNSIPVCDLLKALPDNGTTIGG